MDLPFLETGVEINAPAAAAWVVITDTRLWSEWRPTIVRVEADERFIRLGSRGWISTIAGLRLPYVISEYDPGHRWRWKLGGIPAVGHRVESVDPMRCRVMFEVPILAAAYLPVCRVAAVRIRHLLDTSDFTGTGAMQQEV
jgi:hypothetical protein